MRLSLELAPADPAAIRALADAAADPAGPPGGAHLGREALGERLAGPPRRLARFRAWLSAAGIEASEIGLGGLRWQATIDAAALARLVGEDGARRLQARRRLVGDAVRELVPAALAGPLLALEVGPWRAPAAPRRLVDPGVLPPPPPSTGVTPAALRRGYDLGDELDGDGETIAMMAIGGVPEAADLHGFARAFGLPAPEIELVPVTPLGACASDPLHVFETTMGLQWLAVAAPRARICVYLVDPGVAADPWAAFLQAVLADRSRAPSIAVTSWSAPARQVYAVHGDQIFAGLCDQAAALGISIVAASGDWGAYDGFPRGGATRDLCERLAAADTFPGCEARVLSVGGTQVRALDPWHEVAWSAPVSAALRAAIGLGALAGGGGVSERVAIPAYQRPLLPASFPRGDGAPAMPARGRVQPDVALMAWGPDVSEETGTRPAAYACLVGGEFRDDAGGTSVAAPIWAGLLARVNQLRRRRGLPRLGQVHPRLYAAAIARPGLLRDVVEGCTDLDLPIVGADGARVWARLPGFRAIPGGFDPATGLGVPSAPLLADALASPRPL